MQSQQRIISLLPSATEIVAALGKRSELVGRSHECDFPPDVVKLPICCEPKFSVDGTSREIDSQVKSTLADFGSIYRLLDDVIERLQPTILITQSQCEVCAVSVADVQRAISERLVCRPEVVAVEPACLDDIWSDIGRIGAAIGAESEAESLVVQLQSRLQGITSARPEGQLPRRVACIEWIDPLMAAGNWVPELIALAGGECLFGQAGQHSPWMEWDELVANQPDVVLVMPCGFDIARTADEMTSLELQPGWHSLRAVCDGEVYLLDGHQYFNRPGPRLVESAEIVAEILHPNCFDFGHAGTGFVRWQDGV